MQLSFRVRMGTGALYMIWPSMSMGAARGLSPLFHFTYMYCKLAPCECSWLSLTVPVPVTSCQATKRVSNNTSSCWLRVDGATVLVTAQRLLTTEDSITTVNFTLP